MSEVQRIVEPAAESLSECTECATSSGSCGLLIHMHDLVVNTCVMSKASDSVWLAMSHVVWLHHEIVYIHL